MRRRPRAAHRKAEGGRPKPKPAPAKAGKAPLRPLAPPRADLSKIRHDLRTPINHILGYCEMLQEDQHLPADFAPDLAKIHAGGKQLLALIADYFDEETFETMRGDVQRLCHDLRTPVNQIIGYSEMLQELAEDLSCAKHIPDLKKIREAASLWLGLMEEHLLPAQAAAGSDPAPAIAATGATLLPPGITFQAPAGRVQGPEGSAEGRLLVVDDDESNRDMLGRRLRRYGYAVETAASGVDALRLLRANPFDLVLLDLIMSGLDGYQVLAKMKADPALREIPVIMLSSLDQETGIARCIEAGAEDYITKPFSPVFLRARIEASLEKKCLRDKERQTYNALVASEKRLADELAEAAIFVKSLLPAPLDDRLKVQWRFQPSAELGGDAFGYHWMGGDQMAIYLLDVSGHGVGAALLSVSVLNLIRAESLPGADFRDPASVLRHLNRVFQMDRHNNLIFTIWYGVFDTATRQLSYASGGHPPAVLLEPAQETPFRANELSTRGPLLGMDPAAEFRSESRTVAPGSRVFVFSDGAYEIAGPDGKTHQLQDLIQQLLQPASAGASKLDAIVAWAMSTRGAAALEDDLSLMELQF
jgi:sigma-B regulation protein RsbU (phosphoserine phosphatase)